MTNETPRFAAGDPITVVRGPYTDFKGIVTHPAPAPGKVGVKLAFFGRKAPMTLDASLVRPLRKGQ
jgi:transcription antitermination factor NusG